MPIYALNEAVPDLDPSAWVAPDASVIGKVRVGGHAGIWFGAVLRGDNEWIEVGEGSNVQEHCVLHTDMGYPLVVGSGCTIGHRAILHGCTIGDGSLIGMGAIVLNGARIGPESLVGAGALVTEGKSFPSRSLIIGSPARAIRELDGAAVAALRESALHYAENARRFRSGLALALPEKAEPARG